MRRNHSACWIGECRSPEPLIGSWRLLDPPAEAGQGSKIPPDINMQVADSQEVRSGAVALSSTETLRVSSDIDMINPDQLVWLRLILKDSQGNRIIDGNPRSRCLVLYADFRCTRTPLLGVVLCTGA